VLCAGSALQLAKQSLDEAPHINCPKPSQTSKLIDIPWFLTEGKLAAIFIKTFSWGFPTGRSFTISQQVFWHHHHRAINKFSSAVAGDLKKKKLLHQLYSPTSTTRQQQVFWRRCRGGREDFCEGSFLHTHHLLCYCFALLYLFYLHCFLSKTQKN
jgi:hypothetical protein